jgi:hypothetical protein
MNEIQKIAKKVSRFLYKHDLNFDKSEEIKSIWKDLVLLDDPEAFTRKDWHETTFNRKYKSDV